MPFVDRSTLTYPATNAFPVRKWLDPARNPASTDYKNFQVFDIWINDANDSAWIMVDRTATDGTWLQMGASSTGILTITGDAGGAVGADGANNINLLSGSNLTVTGTPVTNTLTITLDGSVASQYDTDAGSAIPSLGILNILGSGGTTTSGAGNTVTVTSGPTVPTSFTADAGSATPALNNLNIFGSGGITTSGAGSTITVDTDGTIATQYDADAGSAVPVAGILNIVGAGATTTSAAGNTVTITSTGGGMVWNEIVVVGPTAMSVDNGYIANNAVQVGLTLPLVSALGRVICVVGKGAGGWKVFQNAGQSIVIVSSQSTVGVGGSVAASEPHATMCIVCTTANTTWTAYSSMGNLIIT